MSPTKTTPARRGRPRKVESYTDWMSRIDASVDTMAHKMERQPPSYAYLHPAQRRIVQMLIEHMRSLPEITGGEQSYMKPEYVTVNGILALLFKAKYPFWTERTTNGHLNLTGLPNGEYATFTWLLHNCAGWAPLEAATRDTEDDD